MITYTDILEVLPFLSVLFISGASGAFAIGLIQKEEREIRYFNKPIKLGFIGDILIGGVTSIGIFFFVEALFFPDGANAILSEDIVKLVSLGILSGVAGINLLTSASKKFTSGLFDIKEEIKSGTDRAILLEINFRADDLFIKNNYDESVELYNEVLQQDPNNEHALIGKAKVFRRLKYCTEGNCLKEAISLLEKAIENNPSAMRAHYNLACYMHESKDYSNTDVLKSLTQAIKISKTYIEFAKGDEDLNDIVKMKEFKKLEEEYS